MSKITSSRACSFVIIAIIYVIAAILGCLVYEYTLNALISHSDLSRSGTGVLYAGECYVAGLTCIALFAADVAATILVWICGLIYKNVSVYDPYWSVLPPVMLTMWALCYGKVSVAGMLLLIAVWYWGIRLTGNWAYTFRNLDTEDWRYTKYRTEQKPVVFQLINFFGLNMMPTIVVFAAMLPGVFLLNTLCMHCYGGGSATVCTWLGFVVCLAATTLQWTADHQKHTYAKAHKGEICKAGLWKHGRHPNYLGEIGMWWGVWIMHVSVYGFIPVLVAGPIAMTCLFLFISIPLMEGRQLKNKPGYADYKKETRLFI